jgi:hypothetical protein
MFFSSLDDIIDSDDFLNSLDIISDSEGKTISVIPFGSTERIEEILTTKVYANRFIKKLKSNQNLVLFELEVYDSNTGFLDHAGKFVLYQLPNFLFTYLIITIENSDFFHKDLRPFIKSFYSEIIFPFIKSTDLIRRIESYKGYNNLSDIIITRASQRIRYHEEMSMSTVTWNNSSLEDAYAWLKENNGWFKSLQFKALVNDREVSVSFIDRNGVVRTEKNFIRIFEAFILPNCAIIENYIKLLRNRSRRDHDDLDVRPISIKYDTSVFREIEDNKKFIQALASLENTSVSILHGNPYIHVAIVDYNDGSTCDLWVLNDNEILITPQLHSSIISLKRLVNHIYDNYAEGELVNYDVQS